MNGPPVNVQKHAGDACELAPTKVRPPTMLYLPTAPTLPLKNGHLRHVPLAALRQSYTTARVPGRGSRQVMPTAAVRGSAVMRQLSVENLTFGCNGLPAGLFRQLLIRAEMP